MKKIILLGTIALFTISCGSDNDDNNVVDNTNPALQNVILPVKMSIDGESMKINYDGTKITNLTSTTNSGNKIVFTYNRDLINNIKFYEGNVLQTSMDYAYNSNNLLSTSINKEYSTTGIVEHSVTSTYTHVSTNQVNVKREVYGSSNSYTVMNSIYNYSNGNMIGSTGSGSNITNGIVTTYTETSTYNYTDKNYTFKNVKGFDKLVHTIDSGDGMSYLFSNIKNNISNYNEASTFTTNNSTGNSFSSFKYTTTFNSSGYPIYESRKSVDANGGPNTSQPEVHTYEYNH